MQIDDDNLFQFMQDVRGSLGRIEEKSNNTVDHLKAVNVKLNGHIADPDAHPAAARNVLKIVLGVVGSLVGLAGLIVAVVRVYK